MDIESKLKDYNVYKSLTAQALFCIINDKPLLAHRSGQCPYCNRNIYKPIIKSMQGEIKAITGISLNEAKGSLITSCPHCNKSFI